MANRRSWFDRVGIKDKVACEGDCGALKFTHGIEIESFLVDKKGIKLSYADFDKVYTSLLSESLIHSLEELIPEFYNEKILEMEIAPSKSSTHDALTITYRAKELDVKTELISVDRNVAEWPLIELATPPCESLYELGWWSKTVFDLANEHLEKTNSENRIMLFGVNPYEKIEDIVHSDSFPTCGEHHHIKLLENSNMSSDDRAFFTHFYHLLRFFTPYLILLSACSPFASGGLWGKYRPNDPELPFPRCLRSIRVLYNKKHLCSFQDGEYMPYLENGWKDQRTFVEEFKRQSNSFRTDTHFFDIDPYSKENQTTEIRFFDSQPSIARRIGIAALIQMLAHKAEKLVAEDKEDLLEVINETNTNLQSLKKMACEGGNWFRPPVRPILGETVRLKGSRFEKIILSDLVLEMLFFLRAEIKESNLIYSHFLDPIRHSIYDLKGDGISPAQYWLFVYINEGEDMDRVVKRILESTKAASDIWYDPVVNEPVRLNDVIELKG
ncbi:MAG: hypothetical protein JSV56_03340 [Methanomassiliicoccales archaeon]|nr:MAG: hypothetical protein JSV56_03340 [Methanomassiliicoccales archaeon]